MTDPNDARRAIEWSDPLDHGQSGCRGQEVPVGPSGGTVGCSAVTDPHSDTQGVHASALPTG
jgi:hypothetical protein